MPTNAVAFAAAVVEPLCRASLYGAVFIGAVWLLCRAFPALPAWLRSGLWWLASLKLVLGLVWTSPIELPLLNQPLAGPLAFLAPGEAVVASRPEAASLRDAFAAPWRTNGGSPPATGTPDATSTGRSPKATGVDFVWIALAGAWIFGVAVQGVLTLQQLRRARRVLRRSSPVASGRASQVFATLREDLNVQTAVELRVSNDVESAQVLGLGRPVVVVPRMDLETLPTAQLEMALAHELLHVRRHDPWLGWLPVVAQRLFFFHPLAAVALREYVLAREAACDAAVLHELGASPREYGHMLLRLGITRREIGAVAVGTPASPKTLERRLRMLQQRTSSGRAGAALWGLVAVVAVAALAPYRVVAVGPSRDHTVSTHSEVSVDTESASYGFEDDEGFVLIQKDEDSFVSANSSDIRRAQRLFKKDKRPLLLYRRGDDSYVIRDAQVLREVDAIFESQQRLGRQQGELGGRQRELGEEQGALGEEQGELGEQQAKLADEQARLAHRQSRSNLSDREERELDAEMDAVHEKMRELGRLQSELGLQQAKLGEKQGALGEQQGELGRQQAKLAREARPKLQAAIHSAIDRGLAEKLD